MSSTLSSLESVYGSSTAEITSQMAKLARLTEEPDNEDDIKKQIDTIEKSFEECSDTLEQMELEIRGFQNINERDKFVTRWQSYSAELRRLNQDFRSKKKKALNKSQRSDLYGQDNIDVEIGSNMNRENQRQTLLENQETLERSGRKLNIGQRLLNETESIGASIMNDLSHQRETLTSARRKLRDTQEDLQQSSKVLTKMLSRITQNKLVLFIIPAIIIVVIILGIFLSLS